MQIYHLSTHPKCIVLTKIQLLWRFQRSLFLSPWASWMSDLASAAPCAVWHLRKSGWTNTNPAPPRALLIPSQQPSLPVLHPETTFTQESAVWVSACDENRQAWVWALTRTNTAMWFPDQRFLLTRVTSDKLWHQTQHKDQPVWGLRALPDRPITSRRAHTHDLVFIKQHALTLNYWPIMLLASDKHVFFRALLFFSLCDISLIIFYQSFIKSGTPLVN